MKSSDIRSIREFLEKNLNGDFTPTQRKKIEKAALALYDVEFIMGRKELQAAINDEFDFGKGSE